MLFKNNNGNACVAFAKFGQAEFFDGFDLFQVIEQDIADCVIDAVVYQDLSSQAYLAVKLLFEEMCYGITHEKKKFYSKLEIITGENLCYFGKSEWT